MELIAPSKYLHAFRKFIIRIKTTVIQNQKDTVNQDELFVKVKYCNMSYTTKKKRMNPNRYFIMMLKCREPDDCLCT